MQEVVTSPNNTYFNTTLDPLTTLQLVLAIYALEDSGGPETWKEAKRYSIDFGVVPAAVSALTTVSLVYANETWSDVNACSLVRVIYVSCGSSLEKNIPHSNLLFSGRSHTKEQVPPTMKVVIHSKTVTRHRILIHSVLFV